MDDPKVICDIVQYAQYFGSLELSKPIRCAYKPFGDKSITVISDVDAVIEKANKLAEIGVTDTRVATDLASEVYYMDVNSTWYEKAEEWEVKFILRYETRRIYQLDQIAKLDRGESVSADEKEIRQWEDNYKNYIPNTAATRHEHFNQACEKDAYIYAKFMEAVEMRNADDSRAATPKNYSYPYSQCPGMEKVIEEIVDKKFEKRMRK